MVHCLTIDLGAPVAASDPYIHLDSFVSYAAGVEAVGRDELANMDDGGEPEYWIDEMPFERYHVDDEWVWATSSAGIAHPDGDGESGEVERWSTTRWRTHFDHDPDHQIKETHINTSSGEFKSYNAALPYSGTDTLRFFSRGTPTESSSSSTNISPQSGRSGRRGSDESATSRSRTLEGGVVRNLPQRACAAESPGDIRPDGCVQRDLPAPDDTATVLAPGQPDDGLPTVR